MSKNPLSVTGGNRLKLGLHEGEDVGLFDAVLPAGPQRPYS